MSNVRDKSTEAVVDEAAEWIVRLSASDAPTSDYREFVAWLKRSPVHVAEYLRIEQTWASLGRVDASKRIDVNALLARPDANIAALSSDAEAAPVRTCSHRRASAMELPRNVRPVPMRAPSHAELDPAGPRALRLTLAIAACIVLLCSGIAFYQWQFANRYATEIGEQRTLKLDDGSTVVLNTHTQLRVRLTSKSRDITLISGEALFNVAKDPSRPFRVRNDQVVAEALGTSFVVREMPTQTVVTVIEGRVAITRSTQKEPIAANAGERAAVSDKAITKHPVANTDAVIAWRSGRLVFDGQPLAEVVSEFNRYNTLQMQVDDAQLSSERISGVFNADQPRSLVRFLERSGAVESLESSDSVIHLRPKR